jgi:hypothetical protein
MAVLMEGKEGRKGNAFENKYKPKKSERRLSGLQSM